MKLHQCTATLAVLAIALVANASPEPRSASLHEQVEALRAAGKPFVERYEDAIYFLPPEIDGFVAMNVRIFNQGGEPVFQARSTGEVVSIYLDELPDGHYVFESVSVIDRPVFADDEPRAVSARDSGEFEMRDGHMVIDSVRELSGPRAPSSNSGALAAVLKAVLDVLVPDATADDLTVSSSAPTLEFDDTDYFAPEWYIDADNSSATQRHWMLVSNPGFNTVMEFARGDVNSLKIRPGGRIEFHIGDFGMLPGAKFGIGTTLPAYPLHISESNPRIYLYDESTDSNMNFEYAAETLIIEGDSFQDIARFHKDAPANSFRIFGNGKSSFGGNVGIGTSDPLASLQINNPNPAIRMNDTSTGAGFIDFRLATNRLIFEGNSGQDLASFDTRAPSFAFWLGQSGNVGLGTTVPSAPLHIYRNDATAEMIWLESNEAGVQDRAMMYLKNNGGIRFEFANPSLGTAWRFQAATGNQDNFEITKVGTGEIEFRVDANGNAYLTGALSQNSDRNAKTHIVPVDADSILDKVAALPIAHWVYRDSPDSTHIGPMAQDFRAVFGTGDSDTSLSAMDTSGVALASIQALVERNKRLELKNRALESTLARIMAELKEIRQTLAGSEGLTDPGDLAP